MMTARSNEDGIRLHKVLANAGVASRRAAEIMIDQGRVEVNGRVVAVQGTRVDPAADVVRVDGSRIPPATRHTYWAINKPRGVVSTMNDPEGRACLADYVADRRERLFHVGRLDTDSEGLLLMTNDGDFAQLVAHPSYAIAKTYLVQVKGIVEPATLSRLRRGITLDDGPIKPDRVKLTGSTKERSMVEIGLHDGRNRIVRRMMEAVGHPVTRLARTAIGPVKLANLASGELRALTRQELGALLDLVGS